MAQDNLLTVEIIESLSKELLSDKSSDGKYYFYDTPEARKFIELVERSEAELN